MARSYRERASINYRKLGVFGFLKKSIIWIARKPYDYVLGFVLARRLKRIATNASDIEAILEIAYRFENGLLRPLQVPSEIRKLTEQLAALKAMSVLEIGTAVGGTLFILCRTANSEATLASIDLPGGKFGFGYPRWRIPIYKAFRLPSQHLYLIRADSHKTETLSQLKAILGGKALDILLIDGDHSYEGVKSDFEMYSPLVRQGGLVIFHDIAKSSEKESQVDEFWNSIKMGYSYEEIIENPSQGWAGIGIIHWKREK